MVVSRSLRSSADDKRARRRKSSGPVRKKALDDAVVMAHQFLKRGPVTPIGLPDVYRGFQWAPQGGMVQPGTEAGYDPVGHEPLHPGSGRVRTQADQAAELPLCQARVMHNVADDFSVDLIYHSGLHCKTWVIAVQTVPKSVDFGSY